MKLKTLIAALVIVGLSACTQRLCPTYADVDTPKAETTEEVAEV